MIVHYAGRRARAAERLWLPGHAHRGGALLRPAELLFRLASRLRNASYDAGLMRVRRAAVPVISVGNLTVGGTGKTPFVRWLVQTLAARGARPAILHGGYGADEPELLRAWFPGVPVIVQRDRAAGAVAAAAHGADLAVLDDGFQHRRLARDLDIVLVAAEQWQHRPRLLPLGPWREPPSALRRAGLIVVTRRTVGVDDARAVGEAASRHSAAGVCTVRLRPVGWGGEGGGDAAATAAPAGRSVLVTAVAAWRPVAEHATRAGADIEETLVFADHHAFDAADAERIRRFAGGRPIVCTAKDWIKLRLLLPAAALRVLELGCTFDDGEHLLHDAVDAVVAP